MQALEALGFDGWCILGEKGQNLQAVKVLRFKGWCILGEEG